MRRKCDMPFKMLKIQMNGDVFACSQGQLVANLYSTDPLDIWNSPRMLELREQLDSENYDAMCRECSLVQNLEDEQPKRNALLKHIRRYRIVNGTVIDGNDNIVSPATNVIGCIDNVTQQGDTKIIQGWAVNAAASRPAGAVIVMVNGITVGAAVLSIERRDVAIALKDPNVIKCGFLVTVPYLTGDAKAQVFVTDDNGDISELQSSNKLSLLHWFVKKCHR